MSDEEKDKGGRPKGEDKEQIIARLPVALVELIRQGADDNKRTISAEVEVLIKKGLADEEPPKSKGSK